MSAVDIELLEVKTSHKAAIQHGPSHLQSLLKVSIPDGWPQFPEAFQPSGEEIASAETWPSFFFISCSENALVGNGGFAGPPDANGEVEIGFEIAPNFQNRGFATAAVKAMLDLAFSRTQTLAVVAHTLAEENASNAVLRKAGMSFVAELPNPEVGAVWRWRRNRSG
jgi:RimJ/RimL family protein N-acetyltransferase